MYSFAQVRCANQARACGVVVVGGTGFGEGGGPAKFVSTFFFPVVVVAALSCNRLSRSRQRGTSISRRRAFPAFPIAKSSLPRTVRRPRGFFRGPFVRGLLLSTSLWGATVLLVAEEPRPFFDCSLLDATIKLLRFLWSAHPLLSRRNGGSMEHSQSIFMLCDPKCDNIFLATAAGLRRP